MTPHNTPRLIAGNWKMNPPCAGEARALAQGVGAQAAARAGVEWLVCPPHPFLAGAQGVLKDTNIALGAQDCSAHEAGAHTGDISAAMARALGCAYVILGHSERRTALGETSALVAEKARRALAAGLTPIVCVGESADERGAGRAQEVVGAQIAQSLPTGEPQGREIVLAYEPLWAIGTGVTAGPEDIAAMHAFIRSRAAQGRILYGGSVTPETAPAILSTENVGGVLVGGASLKPGAFAAIGAAAPA